MNEAKPATTMVWIIIDLKKLMLIILSKITMFTLWKTIKTFTNQKNCGVSTCFYYGQGKADMDEIRHIVLKLSCQDLYCGGSL